MQLQTNTTFTRPDFVDETLYVITTVFNPHRYRSRWKLYKAFEKYVLDSFQAHLVTIECTYGNRAQALVQQQSEKHTVIHVQTSAELWIKENLINLAISRLPADWKYVAWIDADVTFARPDWVGEAIQRLQHWHVVQMFSQAADLGPDYQVLKIHNGFVKCYREEMKPAKSYSNWHPGFAWAARREYIDTVGGLIDFSILGAADRNMATALIGRLDDSIPPGLHANYVKQLRIWACRAAKVEKNIGYMEGLLLHYWHGAKKHRKYKERWQILIEEQYDPEQDLKKDWQGVWQISRCTTPVLRDSIRAYFGQRNEDSIDL
jgi:hypothetical protein